MYFKITVYRLIWFCSQFACVSAMFAGKCTTTITKTEENNHRLNYYFCRPIDIYQFIFSLVFWPITCAAFYLFSFSFSVFSLSLSRFTLIFAALVLSVFQCALNAIDLSGDRCCFFFRCFVCLTRCVTHLIVRAFAPVCVFYAKYRPPEEMQVLCDDEMDEKWIQIAEKSAQIKMKFSIQRRWCLFAVWFQFLSSFSFRGSLIRSFSAQFAITDFY